MYWTLIWNHVCDSIVPRLRFDSLTVDIGRVKNCVLLLLLWYTGMRNNWSNFDVISGYARHSSGEFWKFQPKSEILRFCCRFPKYWKAGELNRLVTSFPVGRPKSRVFVINASQINFLIWQTITNTANIWRKKYSVQPRVTDDKRHIKPHQMLWWTKCVSFVSTSNSIGPIAIFAGLKVAVHAVDYMVWISSSWQLKRFPGCLFLG
jgi:hypothetical protein